MKTTIGCIGCAVLAFAGMQAYQMTQTPEPTQPEQQTEVKKPIETTPPSTGSKPKSTTSNTSKPKSTVTKRSPSKTTRTTSTSSSPRPARGMYYTTEGGSNGKLPSRFVIHNTEVGRVNIMVMGFGNARGSSIRGKGSVSGKGKKHTWEVKGAWGNIQILWDGKQVSSR